MTEQNNSFHTSDKPQQYPYHRLAFADSASRWWKPLVEGLLGGAIYCALSVGLVLIYWAFLLRTSPGGLSGVSYDLGTLQREALVSPVVFLLVFVSVALLWPSLWLARLAVGPRPWGLIHSVEGRIRWQWLLLCAGISAVFYILLPLLLELFAGSSPSVQPAPPGQQLTLMSLLIFLVVPLQCYAEELVFRGYLIQSIGRWLKAPVWAVLISALLFTLGHAYDVWGQAQVLVMGLTFGFLAWYTGGLEAGIALHTVNNLYSMLLGVMGLADPFAQQGTSFISFISTTCLQLLLLTAVVYAAKRTGVSRTRLTGERTQKVG